MDRLLLSCSHAHVSRSDNCDTLPGLRGSPSVPSRALSVPCGSLLNNLPAFPMRSDSMRAISIRRIIGLAFGRFYRGVGRAGDILLDSCQLRAWHGVPMWIMPCSVPSLSRSLSSLSRHFMSSVGGARILPSLSALFGDAGSTALSR